MNARPNLPLDEGAAEQCAPDSQQTGSADAKPAQQVHTQGEAPKTPSTREYAERYIAAGLKLCAVEQGSKGPKYPGWPDNPLGAEAITRKGGGIGLLHVQSGTCAIDVDDLDASREAFGRVGIDLDAMLTAPDAVQVVSGRENRAKLLYRLPDGVRPRHRTGKDRSGKTMIEFRCADAQGSSIQDCLPPTIHPDTGKPYQWGGAGSFERLPMLPAALLKVWQSPIPQKARGGTAEVDPDRAQSALDALESPDAYDTWRDLIYSYWAAGGSLKGAIAHSHQDAKTEKLLQAMWRSFDPDRPGGITAGTLYRYAMDAGWKPPAQDDDVDFHRSAPVPEDACLYGLVGDVARLGSTGAEAHPHAVALNFIVFMSAAVGRVAYRHVSNTVHHVRLFGLHVGRSGRGRKTDAVGLVKRISKDLPNVDALDRGPKIRDGGLSTREGLVLLVHDGFTEGKKSTAPVADKRLFLLEYEFANVLAQSHRDGNTLSSALRQAWDGSAIEPATKGTPIGVSEPHVALMGSITRSELRAAMAERDLTNGFANRFIFIWAERTQLVPLPRPAPADEVRALAVRIHQVLEFVGAGCDSPNDTKEVLFSPAAEARYAALYTGELNSTKDGELVAGLLERGAAVVVRMAMLFALLDLTLTVEPRHLDAAAAWVRYWRASVKFIFSTDQQEVDATNTSHAAQKILEFLRTHGSATRTELRHDCFQKHVLKTKLDAALDELLTSTPPQIAVELIPRPAGTFGSPTKKYFLQK